MKTILLISMAFAAPIYALAQNNLPPTGSGEYTPTKTECVSIQQRAEIETMLNKNIISLKSSRNITCKLGCCKAKNNLREFYMAYTTAAWLQLQ